MTRALAFQPKGSDGVLRVLIIGRISTEHQDIENIDASYRYVEDYLGRVYDGPTEIRHLGERASGMLADRNTIREASDLIETGEWDLVIAEDLARIFRNPRHQYNFVQDAVDAQTRLICIADNLDTADENWELMLGAATLRHGLTVSDTRRRVRRTATHSFHNGGMVQKVRFGYWKLSKDEADSGNFGPAGLLIAKIKELTPVIQEMARRVIDGASYVSVAEWLQQEGIGTPPYVVNGRWSGRVVKELLRDPILMGRRTFRDTICEPVYRTGRHRRRKNDSPETECIPELAHLTESQYQKLTEVMRQREVAHRHTSGRSHPLYGRSRKRSQWPAQHARCAVCGDLMYRYDRTSLKCRNANRSAGGTCWNHIQVKCDLAREVLLTKLFRQLSEEEGFTQTIRSAAMAELERCLEIQQRRDDPEATRLAELQRQSANLTDAIAAGGQIAQLIDRLRQVDREMGQLQRCIDSKTESTEPQTLYARLDQPLDRLIIETLADSLEFAELIRSVCPQFDIVPVQALDTSQVRPMARLVCELAAPVEQSQEDAARRFQVEAWLFEPPLHVGRMDECVQLKKQHPRDSLKEIAQRTGLSHMTVKRAFDYARRMEKAGVDSPYQVLTSAPSRASRWKRRAGAST